MNFFIGANLKFKSAIKIAVGSVGTAALLTACGGGGETIGGAGDVSNDVSPGGTSTLVAGASIVIEASAKAYFDGIAGQKWSVTKVAGAESASAPTIVDPNCAGATKTPGNPSAGSTPGRNGTSICRTTLSVPIDVGTSEWLVTNTAQSSKGSAAGSFTLKVTANQQANSGFVLQTPKVPFAFEMNKVASIPVNYSINAGIKLDSPVKYQWTQLSGPPVGIAGGTSEVMSYVPRVAGEYVFKIKATTVVNGKQEVSEGAVVAVVAEPAAPEPIAQQFIVNAGGIQAVEKGATVTLKGVVTGPGAAENLRYSWSQRSGPAVVLFNKETLTPQFQAVEAGDYVFTLNVTNETTKNAVTKTADTFVSVYEKKADEPFFTVSAGTAKVGKLNEPVELVAEVANGVPAPKNLTYRWTQKGGPSVNLSGASSLAASFIPSAFGTYTFEVTATSGTVSKSDTVSVTVSDTTLTGNFNVSAGGLQAAPVSTTVTLTGAVSGTVKPEELTLEWAQTSGTAVTLYGQNSLNAQFVPPVPGEYVFELRARRIKDATSMKTASTMVAVYSPYESPNRPFFAVSAGNSQVVEYETAVVLTGQVVTGKVAPDGMTYKWVQLSGPNVTLSNDETLSASFVPEGVGLYVFELYATSGGETKRSTTSVQVLAPKAN